MDCIPRIKVRPKNYIPGPDPLHWISGSGRFVLRSCRPLAIGFRLAHCFDSMLARTDLARSNNYVSKNKPEAGGHYPAADLPLRELEALSCSLLSVLLALFAARIAREQTFTLQLLAQLDVELQQCAGNAHLHRVGLTVDSAAM